FFSQAEAGIRDFHVTGVQTCALPICTSVLLALVLAGCAVGPDYHQPDSQAPAQFNDTAHPSAAAASVTMQSEPDPRWWRGFNDQIGRASCRERVTRSGGGVAADRKRK